MLFCLNVTHVVTSLSKQDSAVLYLLTNQSLYNINFIHSSIGQYDQL